MQDIQEIKCNLKGSETEMLSGILIHLDYLIGFIFIVLSGQKLL